MRAIIVLCLLFVAAQASTGKNKICLSNDEIDTIIEQALESTNSVPSIVRRIGAAVQNVKMHIVVMKRGDLSFVLRSQPDAWEGSKDIARAKAYTALAFSSNENALTSRTIGILSRGDGPLWQIGDSNRDKGRGIISFPGGVPLYKNGVLVGAIGVSGDGVDQDEAVAVAGAVGFEAPAEIRSDVTINTAYTL